MIKNWLTYIGIVILSFVFAYFYKQYSAYLVAILVIIIPPLYSFLIYIVSRRKIAMKLIPTELSFVKNKKTRFEIEIRCDSAFAIGSRGKIVILLQEGMGKKSKKIKLPFVIKESRQKESFEVIPRLCGKNTVKIKKAKVFWGFSLFSTTIVEKTVLEYLILPELNSLSAECVIPTEQKEEVTEGDLEVYSSQRPGSDPSELFDIRAYQPGDKLNRIDWKLSRKHNELMIKEFGLPLSCNLSIFWDVPASVGEARFEVGMERLYAMLGNLVMQGQMAYVVWLGGEENGISRKLIQSHEDLYEFFMAFFDSDLFGKNTNLPQVYRVFCETYQEMSFWFHDATKKVENEELAETIRSNEVQCIPI